ncbi:uncharacterized protein LOC110243949 [Exaiptasia diaphana]|uniref:Insulin-like domain-containing protein n=1 Tax=Exaiptasia diaphana TaxID=2652724 RepID=A0A913YP67_EXADI|nr:uncharacterized protein LOC110243949 [Exaiptasia diaphana]KXJ11306.1 hypothetical protein AC249_AIPGENE15011 [Exaiptasia diaphana]
MKTPVLFVVVVAVLIVTDSAEGFKGKKKLCSDELHKMFVEICQPPTEKVPERDANSFLKPLQRRGLEEECCQETCSYHEIWENC